MNRLAKEVIFGVSVLAFLLSLVGLCHFTKYCPSSLVDSSSCIEKLAKGICVNHSQAYFDLQKTKNNHEVAVCLNSSGEVFIYTISDKNKCSDEVNK